MTRPGYKVLRTTLVLAMSSAYLRTISDPAVSDAMRAAVVDKED